MFQGPRLAWFQYSEQFIVPPKQVSRSPTASPALARPPPTEWVSELKGGQDDGFKLMIIRGQSINAIREKCRHWTRLAADEHYSSPRFLINIPKCDHHFSYTTIRAPANLWQLNEILGKERVSVFSRILLQSKAFFNLMIFQKNRQVNLKCCAFYLFLSFFASSALFVS